jgi:hypothetical protein
MVRYRLKYFGSSEDPTPDDLLILNHLITGWLNGTAVYLASLLGPPISVTMPGSQPVPFGPLETDGSVFATATTINGEFQFDAGPGDQINLPSSFDIILNEQPVPVEDTHWGGIKALYSNGN